MRHSFFLWIQPVNTDRPQLGGAFRMNSVTNGAVKTCYLRTGYCLHWEQVSNALFLLGYIREWDFFLPFLSLSGLLVTSITFWLNAYSIIKCLLSLLPLWEGFLGWEKILLLIIFPQYPLKHIVTCCWYPTHMLLPYYLHATNIYLSLCQRAWSGHEGLT